MQGYGATELSPVVSANLPNRSHNPGNRASTIGRPIPGVEVRTVSLDTLKAQDYGDRGLLQVRGPNVMNGYLNDQERTREVITPDGWYNTGDIASIDSDGFITLEGRLSRFSKIAGEMVPHGAVEDVLQQAAGCDERAVAVTSVDDPRKGERLVVFHLPAISPERLQYACKTLPPLWRPHIASYHSITELPALATGKLDLGALRRLAVSRTSPRQTIQRAAA